MISTSLIFNKMIESTTQQKSSSQQLIESEKAQVFDNIPSFESDLCEPCTICGCELRYIAVGDSDSFHCSACEPASLSKVECYFTPKAENESE